MPTQPRQQQPGQPDSRVGRLLRGGARQFPTLQPPGRADGGHVSVLHARRIAAVLRLRQSRARVSHRAPGERLRGKAHCRSVTCAGLQQPFSSSPLHVSANAWTSCPFKSTRQSPLTVGLIALQKIRITSVLVGRWSTLH